MNVQRQSRLVVSVVLAGLMGLVLAVNAASAQPANRPGGRGWGRGGMGVAAGPLAQAGIGLRQLNLSDEQRQQVRDIMARHREAFAALAERAAPTRRALAEAIATGDEAAIRQASATVAAVQADRAVLTGKVRSEVFAVLTPEQREKAKEARARFERRAAARRAVARRAVRR